MEADCGSLFIRRNLPEAYEGGAPIVGLWKKSKL